MKQELTYWVTLAMIPKMWTKRKNEIYVKCYLHSPRISIIQLFEEASLWDELGLDSDEKRLFSEAKSQLANNSFLVEELLAQGYNIIPIDSADFPRALKDNLKQGAPTVIFTKGNLQLLKKESVAIVGSRYANNNALTFTENVAHKEVSKGNIIVSGFAKGVDRHALDAAIRNGGESIIVLPQGITTFGTGFKQYYKQILQGKILVLSTFHPKAPWSVEHAMSRNSIIYALGRSIYVAQSDSKGGTWSGVIDGLRKGRDIYIRIPESGEKTANMTLIEKGAKAVDMEGTPTIIGISSIPKKVSNDEYKATIIKLLTTEQRTSQEIKSKINVSWSDNKMKKFLREMESVEEFKEKKRIFFRLKMAHTPTLFDN